jgi:hypothetical protein
MCAGARLNFAPFERRLLAKLATKHRHLFDRARQVLNVEQFSKYELVKLSAHGVDLNLMRRQERPAFVVFEKFLRLFGLSRRVRSRARGPYPPSAYSGLKLIPAFGSRSAGR